MRHFRQIGYYRIASDVFAQHHGERRWVITELGVVEHFTQVDGLAFFIRQLKPDIRFARDHLHHAHGDR